MHEQRVDGNTNGPIRESTKAFFQLHGWKKFGQFLHGYYYLARLDQYLKILLPAFRLLNKVVPESRIETAGCIGLIASIMTTRSGSSKRKMRLSRIHSLTWI